MILTITPSKERLRYLDGELIIDSINQLGYVVEFEPKEKYFKRKKRKAWMDDFPEQEGYQRLI